MFSKYLEHKHLISKENLIEFSYNEFINKPLVTVKKIYDYLRLSSFNQAKPYFTSYVHKHRNYKASNYSFTTEEKQKIHSNWKHMFDAYSYTS
jgi:hypothetical protein